jgi:uncharacterized protein
MTLDWIHFTPGAAVAGGTLIGVAAAIYLLGNGRIAGIAGLIGEPLSALLRGRPLTPHATRLLFLLGLLLSPWLWQLAAALPARQAGASTGGLIAAGLLVGFGSRLGNGCTSGHGVCGLSRLSLRSLVNVLVFMGAGFATVAVTRHLLG